MIDVNPRDLISIIGCGLIGRSWAVAFARAGHSVILYDPTPAALEFAEKALGYLLEDLGRADLLRGQQPAMVRARIRSEVNLSRALQGAVHVQENTPEDVTIKRGVFEELDRLAHPEAVIASSTSALLPSQFSSDLPGARRCLVAHPLNPPHLIPAVEIVPSPQTAAETVTKTQALFTSIGQKPILVAREIEGFVMNRLQGAVLDEAFRLLCDGLATAPDLDIAMKDGLALRWSFMGPFETMDLNAPGGIADFMDRYRSAYAAIGQERAARVVWSDDVVSKAFTARRAALPIEKLAERQVWRDRRLAALALHKLKANKEIGD